MQKDVDSVRITLYTVAEKDTIASVSEKFSMSSVDLIFANQLYNNQVLYPGQVCGMVVVWREEQERSQERKS